MRKVRIILLAVTAFILASVTEAQQIYPQGYFRSPIDFRILISGSFAEVRPNHFHSGIDIRTGGVTGKPVYAVADGYVSRIFISATGFGRALYITHPNGYVTVYGHLQGFNNAIGSWIRAQQYHQESFEMDITVPAGLLKVKKGEVVAYSGNAGISAGPHLHFEIRDAVSQETINPILFGIPIQDNIPPEINAVKIYPFDDYGMVNFAGKAASFPVVHSGAGYSLKMKDTILVSGKIYFGIEAIDHTNDDAETTGINSVDLYVDTTHYYHHAVDRFPFSETKYVNALLDYPAAMVQKQRFQRSYIAQNNKMGIYTNVLNRGIVSFTDNRIHKITYIVKDPSGNTSQLVFWVKSHYVPPMREKPVKPSGTLFSCLDKNYYKGDGFNLDVPKDALYEDFYFHCSEKPRVPGTYAHVYKLQDNFTPLQKSCTLSIHPDYLPKKLCSKAVIVRVSESGHFASCGGSYKDGMVTAQIREFGDYSVAVDTIPPKIAPVNFGKGKHPQNLHSITLRISDNLSGIRSFRGTMNGKWILMEFDAKSSLLTYTYDDRMHTGKNDFFLTVKDACGNESVYKTTLFR
ncbi:MAG: M23 family metallopeptidase [Bacteroidota bacterium]|nr:M23 family metallopeptidase [Bacteroidota bacterium]